MRVKERESGAVGFSMSWTSVDARMVEWMKIETDSDGGTLADSCRIDDPVLV